MYSPERLTIIAFGISSFGLGVLFLIDPSHMLSNFDLPPAALPSVQANALAAIAMGSYYSIAAYQNNIPFHVATVPMRLLTASVFWSQGWRAASLWEGIGSVATALALWWEWSWEKSKTE